MRPAEPGEVIAVGLVGAALAADYLLVRRDCHTISTCVRRGWVSRAAVVFLAAHLLVAMKYDPLRWLGSKCVRLKESR